MSFASSFSFHLAETAETCETAALGGVDPGVPICVWKYLRRPPCYKMELGGGFKKKILTPILGEMIQFD